MSTATMTGEQYTFEGVAAEQAAMRSMERHEQVDRLHALYPHLERRWLDRRIGLFLAFDASSLVAALGYPDPTGEVASRRADRARERAAKVASHAAQ